MLKIYEVVLEVVRELRPAIEEIERKDKDLGRQMRRAVCSVALNVSEGAYSRGGNKAVRYNCAMGSMRETLSCVEVGVALGYLDGIDAGMADRIDRVVRTLH